MHVRRILKPSPRRPLNSKCCRHESAPLNGGGQRATTNINADISLVDVRAFRPQRCIFTLSQCKTGKRLGKERAPEVRRREDAARGSRYSARTTSVPLHIPRRRASRSRQEPNFPQWRDACTRASSTKQLSSPHQVTGLPTRACVPRQRSQVTHCRQLNGPAGA